MNIWLTVDYNFLNQLVTAFESTVRHLEVASDPSTRPVSTLPRSVGVLKGTPSVIDILRSGEDCTTMTTTDDAFELTVSVNWFHALNSQNEMRKTKKNALAVGGGAVTWPNGSALQCNH